MIDRHATILSSGESGQATQARRHATYFPAFFFDTAFFFHQKIVCFWFALCSFKTGTPIPCHLSLFCVDVNFVYFAATLAHAIVAINNFLGTWNSESVKRGKISNVAQWHARPELAPRTSVIFPPFARVAVRFALSQKLLFRPLEHYINFEASYVQFFLRPTPFLKYTHSCYYK